MKKLLTGILFATTHSFPLFSQSVDWSSSVASIIYNHCATCHHDGGIAPFSLTSYDDAVAYGISIQQDVNASKMPPWPPDPSFSHFRDEKVLSDNDVATINDWVNEGMPAGNLALAPAPPVFSGNSMMTNIDSSIQFPAYTVQLQGDEYRTFVIHSGFSETKFLNQVEFLPGNGSIVHHVFLFQDTTDVSWKKDADDPEPGFAGGGLGGFSPGAVLICGWIPGSDIVTLPVNMGFEIKPGADFVISVHYAPGSVGKTDSMKINFKYATTASVRPVNDRRLLYYHLPSLINPPFEIPANQVKTFYEKSVKFFQAQSMIALQPHMHLIGKSFKVYMVTEAGDTTNLLYIPDWSFHWQMDYFLTKVLKVPKDAQIFGEAFFDNTINNANNPNNPPEDVHAGESTFDEMMGCHFTLLDYHEGDENIILDSSFYSSAPGGVSVHVLSLEVFPNPVNDEIDILTTIPAHEIHWTLTNTLGTLVKEKKEKNIPDGIFASQIDVTDLSPGMYFLAIASGSERALKKVMVVK